ncbi:membrane protein implicated in regulation of membrane protease activity [Methylopila capsulata]|uniref:Membrane protein n=1 Tax=Methylopila capsulata TaxID=61654 RepID=A0A9W6IPM5_9HYPH|nr:NfeD family protein [Methylopila capsulata]MBM7851140.1 membrane protein implicated in regulation of membrane protease activity [Methylopila capsulata]GLK54197.1 membrane protein [Methylopila capsulata]
MLVELIGGLGPWRWVVLGVALLAIELVAPGTVLLWLGLAAIAVGALAFLVDPGWQTEVLAFAVLGLAAAVGWWFFGRRDNAAVSDRPLLNRRAHACVGRVLSLDEPLVDGAGRVRIDDTVWRATGPDLPAGARVRVMAAEGSTLKVKPAD